MLGRLHRAPLAGARGAALGAVLALLALVPPPARAEGRRDDAPGRAWRALRRATSQLGAATGRALREFEAGVEQGLASGGGRPAAEPEPEVVADGVPPAPEGADAESGSSGADSALDPFFGAERPEPAPAPERSRTTPAAEPTPRAAKRATAPRARLALLGLGVLAATLAGVALAVRRRRRAAPADDDAASPPAIAPPAPAVLVDTMASPSSLPTAHALPTTPSAAAVPLAVPATAAPEPTLPDTVVEPRSGERTTRPRAAAPGFDPAALDARAEAALADALARSDERPTPFPGAGRYELLAEIGRGGMGVVYQARDKRLDRIVALKRLPENLQTSPRAVQLLLREARAAARLNHPHIVTVYDVDYEDGAYFLTMEFLEGQPLSTLLRRRGRFTAAEVAWLGRQAAAGLAYAHARHVVHRDVKTANLFLTRDRVVKIMDFGLAKMIEAARRRATRIGGTPDYMAPEQTLGLEVDGRADLYALGATFYELLTGSVPFVEGDAMRHHRETPAPDPRARVPDLPAALAELVLQLLAKQPAARPASAGEVAERLRAIEAAAARPRPG